MAELEPKKRLHESLSVRIRDCRLCDSGDLTDVLDLGDQPISNRLTAPGTPPPPRFPLSVMLCGQCGLAQLTHDLPATAHFHDDYTYLSGTSSTWVEHCERYAADLIQRIGLGPDDLVVEVGSNDGTLLKAFAGIGAPMLGIEPSANVAELARQAGVPTETLFFGADAVEPIRAKHGSPRLIVANNVLAHVPDPAGFLAAARDLLGDDGIIAIEFPHNLQLLDNLYFDTIYHEHYCYLGVRPIARWAERNGLTVHDAIPQPTHGGSIRLLLGKASAKWSTADGRDRVRRLIDAEQERDPLQSWLDMGQKLHAWRDEFAKTIAGLRRQGLAIGAYGAASKATVLANYVGLTARNVSPCADASPLKQGLIIPGTGIPIVSPDELAEAAPDVVIVFPWNIFDEIAGILSARLKPGTRLLRPLPDIRLTALGEAG